MEDPITETPPPSRFFEEDLDTFAAPPLSIPAPFLLLNPSNRNPKPDLLIVAISQASISLVTRLSSKTLIGSLFLPEIPLSGNFNSKPFNLFSVEKKLDNICLASVEYTLSPERSRAVAKCLLGGVKSEKVLILDGLKSQNYRGRIHVDETLAFKLETTALRRSSEKIFNGIDYLPSGSVLDGLGAAIMTECQMKGIKGALLSTWPENGGFGVLKRVFQDLGFDVSKIEEEFRRASSRADLDLYT